MSSLSGKTKKVTVYGRKKAQIISIHTDFSPHKTDAPLRTPPLPIDPSPTSPTITTVKRPPLQAKISQDAVNIPRPPSSIRKAKGKAVLPSPESDIVVHKSRRFGVASRGRPMQSPSPLKVRKTANEVVYTPRRRNEAIVQIPVSSRKAVPTNELRGSSIDLIERIERITISGAASAPASQEATSSLGKLLNSCSSDDIHPFSAFLTSPSFSSLVSPNSRSGPTSQKLGEASYSEVFGFGTAFDAPEVVVKVIPLITEALYRPGGPDEVELPDCSEPEDVLREIMITKKMAGLPGGGFVDFLGAFVVEGTYPETLLEQWDSYRKECGTDSIRPDGFGEKQNFALIILSYGGSDLEMFNFDSSTGWLQAAGVFWQVADALARAEQWVRFEHRDLHEGQILISGQTPTAASGANDYLLPHCSAVRATIIDFGLSRLDMPESEWSTLPEEVYEGVGAQWDVYRQMRDRVGRNWEGSHPVTNVMWLHYLLRRLLHSTKSLRKPRAKPKVIPSTPLRPSRRVAIAAPARRNKVTKEDSTKARAAEAYYELVEAEKLLAESLGSARKGRRTSEQLGSAVGVMARGRDMGWIK